MKSPLWKQAAEREARRRYAASDKGKATQRRYRAAVKAKASKVPPGEFGGSLWTDDQASGERGGERGS